MYYCIAIVFTELKSVEETKVKVEKQCEEKETKKTLEIPTFQDLFLNWISYNVNFNNFGFRFAVKFDKEGSPLDGGVIHLEIPVQILSRILRSQPGIASQIMTYFNWKIPFVFYQQQPLLDRLADVLNIKLEIAYNGNIAETISGGFNAQYVITHQDTTEESGMIKMDLNYRPGQTTLPTSSRENGSGSRMAFLIFQVLPNHRQSGKPEHFLWPLQAKINIDGMKVKMTIRQQNDMFEEEIEPLCFKDTNFCQIKLSVKNQNKTWEAKVKWDKRNMEKIEFTRSEDNEEKSNILIQDANIEHILQQLENIHPSISVRIGLLWSFLVHFGPISPNVLI